MRVRVGNVFVDELTLMIHPMVAGKGKRLCEAERTLKRMKLVESTIAKSGVSILTCQPA